MKCCVLICCLWGLSGLFRLAAQPQGLSFSFIRQNNFTYATRLDLNRPFEKGRYRAELRLQHDNLLNSSNNNAQFVQFNLRSHLWQYFRLNEKTELASWWENDHFVNADNYRSTLYAGVRIKPLAGIEISPLIGYGLDYRSRQMDWGASPLLRLRARYRFADGLSTETDLFARVKFIHPRQQRNISLNSQWAKQFDERLAVSFGLQGGMNEIDDYRGTAVERILSDSLRPWAGLRYQLLPGLAWLSDNSAQFTRRMFRYKDIGGAAPAFNDVGFAQEDVRLNQQLMWAYRKHELRFSWRYEFQRRLYELENQLGLVLPEYRRRLQLEQQKDYLRRGQAFDLSLNWRPGFRHEMSLEASNQYVQYDTPSESNYDDHDELNYGLAAELRSRWSGSFYTRYRLAGNVRQYAFLFRQRSQENYTQYALRLDFSTRWEPLPRFVLNLDQFIYVTYNIKDFSDPGKTNRSTRNLETRAEAQWQGPGRWQSSLSLYRRETHLSYIRWEQFSESPLDTNFVYLFEWKNERPAIVNGPFKGLSWEFGYKHVIQQRYQGAAMTDRQGLLVPVSVHQRNHQTGPVTGLRLRRRGINLIELSVWWQYQRLDYRYWPVARFTTLTNKYRQEDLELVRQALRPFVTLRLQGWGYGR